MKVFPQCEDSPGSQGADLEGASQFFEFEFKLKIGCQPHTMVVLEMGVTLAAFIHYYIVSPVIVSPGMSHLTHIAY